MSDIKLVGIDPGKSAGGLAIYVDGELIIQKLDVKTDNLLFDQIWELSDNTDYETICLVEDAVINMVGLNMPGIFKSSTRLAHHCGALDMCLALASIPYTKVSPRKWMSSIVPDRPKGNKDSVKNLRKKYIRDVAQARFPDTQIPIYMGDAVGVLMYLMKERGVL